MQSVPEPVSIAASMHVRPEGLVEMAPQPTGDVAVGVVVGVSVGVTVGVHVEGTGVVSPINCHPVLLPASVVPTQGTVLMQAL